MSDDAHAPPPPPPPPEHPPGQYAIVELFGRQTLVGRIEEIDRFGTKMLSLESLFRDILLPPVLHGGAALYRLTPCSAEVAFAQQPRHAWHLPATLRALIPPDLLDGTADLDLDLDLDEGDRQRPF